jgi:aminopeptidase S
MNGGDAALPALTRRVLAGATTALLVACSTTAGPTVTPRTSPPTVSPIAASPSPIPNPTSSPSPLTSDGLRAAVEVADIRAHLEELQRIADTNGANRATGTSGFAASVEYVAEQLADAGYEVERQDFAVGAQASTNLLVERAGASGEVVMLGAHLDSVIAGPGINDNGTGVATLLVLAARLAESPDPHRTIRLAFWGAEEGGPFGSQVYVDRLGPAQRERIVAYLNFDMLGSTNFIRFVYAEALAAPGSAELTSLFASYFEGLGLAWEPIDLTGHADHGAFVSVGIPTGGLFSGGREPKTVAQAAAFRGTAGVPADSCSDVACDTIDNVNDVILDQMADAVAHAVATLAAQPEP